MKLILTAILLFTLGFFGTGLAIHPNSPLTYKKIATLFAKEENPTLDGIEEVIPHESEQTSDTTTNKTPDTSPDSGAATSTDKISSISTSAPQRPVVTKRAADVSKPIVLSSSFVQLTQKNITEFLGDKNPNFVIIGNFDLATNADLIDSLNVLSEVFPQFVSDSYVINTASTELTIERGALIIDENLSVSTSAAIYYQRGALIHYHRSLKSIEYSDLHNFVARVYE